MILGYLWIFSAPTALSDPLSDPSSQRGYITRYSSSYISSYSSSYTHPERFQGHGYALLLTSSRDDVRQDSTKDSTKDNTKKQGKEPDTEQKEEPSGLSSISRLPRLGHQIQMGLSLIQARISLGRTGTEGSTANRDLYGLFVRYSYHSALLTKLHYFVGTGTEITARSQVSTDSFEATLPDTYNIPSFWIGLVAPSDRPFNLWLSLEYGLRWWSPLNYEIFSIPEEIGGRTPQDVGPQEVGLKTDDIEVHIQANYFFTSSKALTFGLAREWLIYRPQDGFLGVTSEALKIDFSVTSWKFSGGMILSL